MTWDLDDPITGDSMRKGLKARDRHPKLEGRNTTGPGKMLAEVESDIWGLYAGRGSDYWVMLYRNNGTFHH